MSTGNDEPFPFELSAFSQYWNPRPRAVRGFNLPQRLELPDMDTSILRDSGPFVAF